MLKLDSGKAKIILFKDFINKIKEFENKNLRIKLIT